MTTPPLHIQPWQLETHDGNMLDRSIWAGQDHQREQAALTAANARIAALESALALTLKGAVAQEEAIALLRDCLAEAEHDLTGARDGLAEANAHIAALQDELAHSWEPE